MFQLTATSEKSDSQPSSVGLSCTSEPHLRMPAGVNPRQEANGAYSQGDVGLRGVQVHIRRAGTDIAEAMAADRNLMRKSRYTRQLKEADRRSFSELTLADVISDPLIGLLNAADNVNARSFAQLLESASRVLF